VELICGAEVSSHKCEIGQTIRGDAAGGRKSSGRGEQSEDFKTKQNMDLIRE